MHILHIMSIILNYKHDTYLLTYLFEDSSKVSISCFLWEKVYHDSKEFPPFLITNVLSFSSSDFSYREI